MTTLIKANPDNDEDTDVRCSECDAVFTIIWSRGPMTLDGPEYCPFCGDEICREPDDN